MICHKWHTNAVMRDAHYATLNSLPADDGGQKYSCFKRRRRCNISLYTAKGVTIGYACKECGLFGADRGYRSITDEGEGIEGLITVRSRCISDEDGTTLPDGGWVSEKRYIQQAG